MHRIRTKRKELGLTLKQLASAVGVTEAAISHYETGRREPDPAMLGRIANVLGTSVDYLLGRDDNPPQPAPEEKKPERTFWAAGRTYSGRSLQAMYDELPEADQQAIAKMVHALFDHAFGRKEEQK